jgi:hypothetical protein
MRPILAVVFGLVASSALACPEPGAERHVITSELPRDAKPDELVLKVSIPQDTDRQHYDRWQTLRARVLQVLQGNYPAESIVLENGWVSPTVRMRPTVQGSEWTTATWSGGSDSTELAIQYCLPDHVNWPASMLATPSKFWESATGSQCQLRVESGR